jgi:hypothetical protein
MDEFILNHRYISLFIALTIMLLLLLGPLYAMNPKKMNAEMGAKDSQKFIIIFALLAPILVYILHKYPIIFN